MKTKYNKKTLIKLKKNIFFNNKIINKKFNYNNSNKKLHYNNSNNKMNKSILIILNIFLINIHQK